MKILVIFMTALSALFGVGAVEYVKGDVVIQREGEWVGARKGIEFQSKDRFVTEKGTMARLKFDDGTLITLGSNTEFSVDSYLYEEDRTDSRARFSVGRGAFKAITGEIARIAPDNFTLKTNTATIGVRGTIVFGEVARGSADRFACPQGSVSVTTASGLKTTLKEGEMTTVAPNAAPTKPQPIDWSQFELADSPLPLIITAVTAVALIAAVTALIAIKKRRKSRKRRR
jgi:hypothetical protein